MTRCSNEYATIFRTMKCAFLPSEMSLWYVLLFNRILAVGYLSKNWFRSLDNNSEYILLLQVLLKYKIASVNKPPIYIFILLYPPISVPVSLFTKYVFLPQSIPFYFYFSFYLIPTNSFCICSWGHHSRGRFSAHSSSAFMVKPSQNIGYALQWKSFHLEMGTFSSPVNISKH